MFFQRAVISIWSWRPFDQTEVVMSEEEEEGEGGHVRKDEEKPGNKVR